MPITLQVVDHEAKAWRWAKLTDASKLLQRAAPKHYDRCKKLVQASFAPEEFSQGHITASSNGFFWTAYEAYSSHHHLVIRPEDVWFAILTQLSFYINAHAEDLRSFFVAHSGQKHLHLEVAELDFAYIANEMTHLIAKNVVDPELRGWVMPSFSTTTDSDKVVGAILFMGAMQKYFSYGVTTACGIPSVTLLGEIDDWKDILNRIDKIDQLGSEPTQFAKMLRPILNGMITSFQSPDSFETMEFWNTIVHKVSRGSGTDYLTGWLTAFGFWDEDGKAKSLSNKMFSDILYPTIDIDSVPAGYASVPISVNDLGDEYEATMVAGSVGTSATSSTSGSRVTTNALDSQDSPHQSADGQERESIVRDTIQPVSGWWVCRNEAAEETEAREAEKARLRAEIERVPKEDWRTRWALRGRLEDLEAY
ncbi:unnamed protein product [Clonostachys byssicola]|uniref:DUF4419 domain-containing protein n=1 Tax=Clonostachys byssicola TaxID=160290 RepID=A0A9N9UW23_9HYPO|nr:unnamed protein product [Clonostachys byssicola]